MQITFRDISSNEGGPYILIGKQLLSEWKGASDENGKDSDYQKAVDTCNYGVNIAHKEPAGMLSLSRNGVNTVFAFDPEGQKAIWAQSEDRQSEGMIVIVESLDDESALESLVDMHQSVDWKTLQKFYPVKGKDNVILSAADSGDNIVMGSIDISLEPGEYVVEYANITSDAGRLTLYRFKKERDF